MTRLLLPLIGLGLGGMFLFGGKFTTPSFRSLSPDEQAIVREQYVEQLQSLLKEANNRMQRAQYAHNMPVCYVYRQMIEQLQDSIRRAQNPACDPNNEEKVIAYTKRALAKGR
jgi:hypothetical protein